MKAIRKIDRALKSLYNLENTYRAEHFLLSVLPSAETKVGSSKRLSDQTFKGALLVRSEAVDMSLGIYLDESIRRELSTFERWQNGEWTRNQTEAFSVASEEISHFHYLIYHSLVGRSVSQFELELQGEIDRFILAYFAKCQQSQEKEKIFSELLEQFFVNFRWTENLSLEEKTRYQEANDLARRFIRKLEGGLATASLEKTLRMLRRFYRLNSCEKVSSIQSKTTI